jgi:hypothetical protein
MPDAPKPIIDLSKNAPVKPERLYEPSRVNIPELLRRLEQVAEEHRRAPGKPT